MTNNTTTSLRELTTLAHAWRRLMTAADYAQLTAGSAPWLLGVSLESGLHLAEVRMVRAIILAGVTPAPRRRTRLYSNAVAL